MIVAFAAAWTGAIALVVAAVVVSIVAARHPHHVLALAALLPVAGGGLAHLIGIDVPAPHPSLPAVLMLAFAVLGVTAGGPLAAWVLDIATHERIGVHGGILVGGPADPVEPGAPAESVAAPREVLRGGATIGYLERIAIVGGLALGRIELIAVVVAIKGLGRFSELDRAETRERFIIGTLVSFIWAGACGRLVAAI